MYSIMKQAETPLRDGRGLKVFRRLYLCDTKSDLSELPNTDAPGSGAVVAGCGEFYLLDNRGLWRRADGAACLASALYTHEERRADHANV